MSISAVLLIDGGNTLRDSTTFFVAPSVGDKISFYKDGRKEMIATVSGLVHQQTEDGYVLVVEAETKAPSIYESRGITRL